MTDQADKATEKKRQAVRSILGLYGRIARHYCPANSVVDAGVAILDELIRSAAPSSALVEAARQLDSQLPVEPTFSLVDGLVTEWNCKCCAAVLKAEYIPDPSNKIFRVRLTNGPDQMQHKPDCDWMAFRAALEGQGTKVCRYRWDVNEEAWATECGKYEHHIRVQNDGTPIDCSYCHRRIIEVKEGE